MVTWLIICSITTLSHNELQFSTLPFLSKQYGDCSRLAEIRDTVQALMCGLYLVDNTLEIWMSAFAGLCVYLVCIFGGMVNPQIWTSTTKSRLTPQWSIYSGMGVRIWGPEAYVWWSAYGGLGM